MKIYRCRKISTSTRSGLTGGGRERKSFFAGLIVPPPWKKGERGEAVPKGEERMGGLVRRTRKPRLRRGAPLSLEGGRGKKGKFAYHST